MGPLDMFEVFWNNNIRSMIEEDWQLVINELVEFEE
jgi:hypothetical protein